jgi:hypothetical protein
LKGVLVSSEMKMCGMSKLSGTVTSGVVRLSAGWTLSFFALSEKKRWVKRTSQKVKELTEKAHADSPDVAEQGTVLSPGCVESRDEILIKYGIVGLPDVFKPYGGGD